MTDKHPGGRPPKTIDDLPENWKKIIFEIAEEGGLDCDIRVALAPEGCGAVGNTMWYRLLDENEEFRQTVEAARLIAKKWWMGQGRKGMWGGKQFNPMPWHITMKNAFGSIRTTDNKKVIEDENFTDRQDITSGGEKISIVLTKEESEL